MLSHVKCYHKFNALLKFCDKMNFKWLFEDQWTIIYDKYLHVSLYLLSRSRMSIKRTISNTFFLYLYFIFIEQKRVLKYTLKWIHISLPIIFEEDKTRKIFYVIKLKKIKQKNIRQHISSICMKSISGVISKYFQRPFQILVCVHPSVAGVTKLHCFD